MARTSAKPTSTMKTMESQASGHGVMSSRNQPTQEQIARRAYEIFLARGGQQGNPEQDWFQAERELRLGR
jgi:hypothetical protein